MNTENSDNFKMKGAKLPEPLRPYARAAYLIRDSEGIHLYDENWMFVVSLKLSARQGASARTTPDARETRTVVHEGVGDAQEYDQSLAGEELTKQVRLIIERFRHAVTLHGIRADYFFEHRLGRTWQDRWERIWKGDLSPMLEDTQEFLPGRDINTREQGGLSTLKGALIHELYINSTLAGRSHGETETDSGRNMLNLLLFVCQLNRKGELDAVGPMLDEGRQLALIDSFLSMGSLFEDKKDVLQRVHQKLVFDYKRGRNWPQKPTAAAVKSTLIFKLYENTNRLDRGDGTDMVRMVRELLVSNKARNG